jgi:hypothetical protein
MRRPVVRIGLAALAAAAVIAGIVVAVSGGAGHGHGHSRALPARASGLAPADLAAAARYLHLSPDKLRLELRRGQTLATIAQRTKGRSVEALAAALAEAKAARLRAALKAGKLSAAAAHAQLATVSVRARAEARRQRLVVGLGGALAPAARYLGTSRQELLRQLRAGHTLAALIAKRKGRSMAGLIDALVAARSSRITAAAGVGALSNAEAAELKATLRKRMSALVRRASAQSP